MGLTAVTTYTVTVLAKDAVNNMSAQSISINGTTTDGSGSGATELFFSEYVEGSSNNKALEIVNITSSPIDLSSYSIKRNGNGGSSWSAPLVLSGTIQPNDVFVIINGSSALQTLIDQADYVHPNNSSTNNGEPINFNGNDPIGLFKNDVLIDIIGVFNGGSANFAKDKTFRRKSSVINQNTTYTISEWDEFPQNTVDNIGVVNSGVLNINDFSFQENKITIYPNPNNTGLLFIKSDYEISTTIYNILGRTILKSKSKKINIESLNSGVYILKFKNKDGAVINKAIIKSEV